MNTIKSILIDSLNGFSANDIPLFIFQLLVAGLSAHILQIIVNKKFKLVNAQYFALIAIVICVLTGIVKYSLPFAIMGLAAILLFRPQVKENRIDNIMYLLVGFIGVGCGVGSVVQTIIGVFFVFGVLLMTPVKNEE